jgi:hypothetical protein
MSQNPDDLVKVADGPLVQVELWKQALADAGIVGRVVGEQLTAGFGSALPDSVELWVHRSDQTRAEAAIQYAEANKGKPDRVPPPHGPIASDPPAHQPAPNRPHWRAPEGT